MKIILELPGSELLGVSEHSIALLLRDALIEFKKHRANGDGAAYVTKRYDLSSYYGAARIEKAVQVTERCRWADALFSADVRIQEDC